MISSGSFTDPEERIIPSVLSVHDECADVYSFESDSDTENLHRLLIPANDPILDNSFDDAALSPSIIDSPPRSTHRRTRTGYDGGDDISRCPDDAQSRADDDHDDDDNDDDDDSEDFSYSDDSRFIDSGWGGECLRETEDIDFDFVYALHTFIATVEGQANATKGDTMVLLDDTNSYWWLVRVVKDGSIGKCGSLHHGWVGHGF